MKRLKALSLLGLLALCAAAPRLPEPVPAALAVEDHAAGARQLDDAAKTASRDDLGWILLYAAELHRVSGDTAGARARFARITDELGSSPASGPASLGIAVIDAGANASGNTIATLGMVPDKGVPDSLNVARYLLLARAKQSDGAPAGDVQKLLGKARKYTAGNTELDALVDAASADIATPAAAAPGVPADLAAIQAIRAATAAGDMPRLGDLAAGFQQSFPDSPFAAEAAYAKRRAETGAHVDPSLVAVLLPLSGSYALPAESLRAAIELGNQRSGGKLKLAFFDTAGSPDQCVKVLEQAALDRGASMVIGPLLKEEALKCAPAAQAIHVPMVTLTSSEEVLAAGDQVYRAFPSTEQLVDALLHETYDVRGLHKYAMVHPTTPFGENAARVFSDAVTARGGTVTARESYDPAAKDFRATAKALGKKDYKARAGEFARLKREAEQEKRDPEKVVLPPIIDYEAIFIPDSYQRVALIASALAFEEFPVGRFKPHREDTPLPLLGLSAWNNDELARRGGNYVLDSIFVDAFDPRAESAAVTSFLDAWKDAGKGDATVVEAVAYDTTRLVSAAVAAGGDHVAALNAVKLADPVAGTSGFGPDRELMREWRLLTVTKEGVRPLAPPEPTDAGQ